MPDNKAIGVMLHSFEFGALHFQFRWEGRSLAPLSCPPALFVKGYHKSSWETGSKALHNTLVLVLLFHTKCYAYVVAFKIVFLFLFCCRWKRNEVCERGCVGWYVEIYISKTPKSTHQLRRSSSKKSVSRYFWCLQRHLWAGKFEFYYKFKFYDFFPPKSYIKFKFYRP